MEVNDGLDAKDEEIATLQQINQELTFQLSELSHRLDELMVRAK